MAIFITLPLLSNMVNDHYWTSDVKRSMARWVIVELLATWPKLLKSNEENGNDKTIIAVLEFYVKNFDKIDNRVSFVLLRMLNILSSITPGDELPFRKSLAWQSFQEKIVPVVQEAHEKRHFGVIDGAFELIDAQTMMSSGRSLRDWMLLMNGDTDQ